MRTPTPRPTPRRRCQVSTSDAYQALEGAHCVVICTAWEEFRSLDLERAKLLMAYPIMVEKWSMMAKGFTYLGTGRSIGARTT